MVRYLKIYSPLLLEKYGLTIQETIRLERKYETHHGVIIDHSTRIHCATLSQSALNDNMDKIYEFPC